VTPEQPVTAKELDAAEKAQNVKVGEGDILLVSTGRDALRVDHPLSSERPYYLGGLDPDCIPWLHERRISVLGSDAVHDPNPSPHPVEDWPIPVHMCGLVGMGLHLLDNLYFADLEKACAEESRWEFFFVVAPLRIEKGTGSPVNPLAIL
jgi:kynurenine formamidase